MPFPVIPLPLLFTTDNQHRAHAHLTHKEDEEDDDNNADGIQLARGYANSSGNVAPTTLVHAEKDSLW